MFSLSLSLQVASISTCIALILGTLAAAAVSRTMFLGKEAITLLVILPIALPGIITGIALRSAFNLADISFSTLTIVLGHATFCIVVVYNNSVARFRRISASMLEASADLGANGFQTFRYILLPISLLPCWRGECSPSPFDSDRDNLHSRTTTDSAHLDA